MSERGWTRRAILASAGGIAAAPVSAKRGEEAASELRRYADPVTEFEVFRLTDPSHASYLPPYPARGIARRGNFLLYSSDRSGLPQVYRVEAKTGQSRQLTEAEALDWRTVCLLPNERFFCYFDGPALVRLGTGGAGEREIYRVPSGWQRGDGMAVAEDGVNALVVERNEDRQRLVLISLARGTATPILQANEALHTPVPRPRRAGILYRRGERLHLVNYDGQQDRPLRMASGTIGAYTWSPDGRTVLYLHQPAEPGRLIELREATPDTNEDKLIAPTSQFVQFGRNGDASVFVGASRNKAGPHVLLLLRLTRRELTLCEHRASDPNLVNPVFSPNSQRVYFQSDKHGKPAIYYMPVEKLVEETEPEQEP